MGLLANDIVQVRWNVFSQGQAIMLVRTFKLVGGGGNPANDVINDLNDITDSLKPGGATPITTAVLNCLPSNAQINSLTAQAIYPTRSAQWEEGLTGQTGLWDGTANVPNNAGVIVFRTELAGRDQVSLAHVGPMPTNGAVAGILTVDYVAALLALANQLVTTIEIAGFEGNLRPVIYHRSNNTSTQLINVTIRNTSRVMRRRTVGLGI